MYAGFSEGTFAANHLGEIRLRYGAAVFGAPQLAGAIEEPTLRQERDLGFDARIRIVDPVWDVLVRGAPCLPVAGASEQHDFLVDLDSHGGDTL